MFCKKCGSIIKEGDLFCGNCGEPVAEKGNSHIHCKSDFIEFFKSYFKCPITFFSKIKNFDAVKIAVSLLIGLPIISGFLTILYNSSFISCILSTIKKVPDYLLEGGLTTASNAAKLKSGLIVSQAFIDFKSSINSCIDKKDLFITGFMNTLIVIALTAVIIVIINELILKQKNQFKNILLVSSASYIPMILSMAVSVIVTYISITLGIFIICFGYVLSFITLYNGIKEISGENPDKVFCIMIILFVVISAIYAIYINLQFKDTFIKSMKLLEEFENLF